MSAKNFSFVTETPSVDSNEGTKTDSGTGLKKVITKGGEISKADSGCNSPELTKLSDADERTKADSGSGSLALKTVSLRIASFVYCMKLLLLCCESGKAQPKLMMKASSGFRLSCVDQGKHNQS